MSKIHEITPIKEGMPIREINMAMQTLLVKLLPPTQMTIGISECTDKVLGGKSCTEVTLKDGSRWVQGDKGIERLIGADYLDKQLKQLENLNCKWAAVETKWVHQPSFNLKSIKLKNAEELPLKGLRTIISDKSIITISRYVGDKTPERNEKIDADLREIEKKTGYSDYGINNRFTDSYTNLREQEDGTIVIIDTEYRSFSSEGMSPEPGLQLVGDLIALDS